MTIYSSSGRHDQFSGDMRMFNLAKLVINRPVWGQNEAEVMCFITDSLESVWYKQIKAWVVKRPAFVELDEVEEKVAALFDRGCQFIVDVVDWHYDEEDWWGLQKMAEEPLVNLSERIILANFTVEMRNHLGKGDPCWIGLEIFTEIVLRARWESYYRDMTSFIRQHYSDDPKFIQSLLDCDVKCEGLLEFVLKGPGQNR